jgi:type II secretory pathway component PulF
MEDVFPTPDKLLLALSTHPHQLSLSKVLLFVIIIIIIIIVSNLSKGRSKASSKTIPPHSAI